MGEPAETQEVSIDAFQNTTHELSKAAKAMQQLADAMAVDAEKNGQRSWFDKHPGIVVTIVGATFTVILAGFQYYFRNELEKGQREFYRNTTQPKVEAVEKSVDNLRTDATKEHKAIRDRIHDIGALQKEQGNDHRKILKDIANKQRVPVKDKSADLKAAEAKVEAKQ